MLWGKYADAFVEQWCTTYWENGGKMEMWGQTDRQTDRRKAEEVRTSRPLEGHFTIRQK
jgi:hypothetical protein